MLLKIRVVLAAAGCLIASLLIFVSPAHADQSAMSNPPSDFRVTEAGFDQVSLAWARVPGAEFYRVLVDGVWRSGVYDPASGVTVTQLQPGVSYTFEVQARAAGGEFGAGTTLRAATRDDTAPPTAPTGLREFTDPSGRSLGLTWNPSTDNWGVTPGYRIFADGRLAMVGGAPTEWFWLTDVYHGGLNCGQTYTFTVKAMDLNGNLSAPSNSLRATTPGC